MEAEFEGEMLGPYIVINAFQTKANAIDELIGIEVGVSDIYEADKREDTIYVFEHEPFVEYTLKIIDIADNMVRVSMKGIAVTDGYARPYISAPFSADAWVKIK
jgi:hypothetical protein